MSGNAGFHGLTVALITGVFAPVLAAPEPAPELYLSNSQSQIEDGALSHTRGVIGVNLSAGDSNAQINARALSISTGQGAASAINQAQQNVTLTVPTSDIAVSRIRGQALANATGLLSVNQASGAGNAQINAIAISVSAAALAVSENELSMTVTGQPLDRSDALDAQQQREVSIDAGAFNGSKGVVQVNQLAGSGNLTSNSFGLSVSLGTKP